MSQPQVLDDAMVRERIADILMVLSAITSGSNGERLTLELSPEDPFAVLYEGINEVVQTLVSGQERLEGGIDLTAVLGREVFGAAQVQVGHPN